MRRETDISIALRTLLAWGKSKRLGNLSIGTLVRKPVASTSLSDEIYSSEARSLADWPTKREAWIVSTPISVPICMR